MTEEPNPVIERLKIQGDEQRFAYRSLLPPEAVTYHDRVPRDFNREGSVPMPGEIEYPKPNTVEKILGWWQNLLRIQQQDPGAWPKGTKVEPTGRPKYPGFI